MVTQEIIKFDTTGKMSGELDAITLIKLKIQQREIAMDIIR